MRSSREINNAIKGLGGLYAMAVNDENVPSQERFLTARAALQWAFGRMNDAVGVDYAGLFANAAQAGAQLDRDPAADCFLEEN